MGKNIEDKIQADIEKAFAEIGKDPKKGIVVLIGLVVGAGYFFRDKLLELFNQYQPKGSTVSAAPIVEIGQTILIWGAVMAAVLILGTQGLRVYHYYYNKKRFRYLRIITSDSDKVDATTLGEMIRRIHNAQRGPIRRSMWGKDWFAFVIHHRKKAEGGTEYLFYIGGPEDRLNSVKNHMSSLYAKAEFIEEDVPMPSQTAIGGRMGTKRKKGASTLSLARYKKDQIPGILKVMKPGTWVQIAFSGDSEYKLKKLIVEAEKEVKADKGWRDRNAFEVEEEKSFKSRFSGNEVSFNVTVSIAAEKAAGWNSVRDTADAISGIMNDVNELKYKRGFGTVRRYPIPWPHRMIWTGSELAKLVHLPESLEGLGEVSKSLESKSGFLIGYTADSKRREVRIERNVLTKHFGLTGITGSGKSTVLNQLLKSFIEENLKGARSPGFSFIDPKKETATIVLNQIMKMELDGTKVNWDKVKWISFKDAKNPPAMNLLYRMPGVEKSILVDQIMRIINEANPNKAHQAERLLKKCIETLLADESVTHTILGVQPLLLKPKFRFDVLKRLEENPKNASLLNFWEDEAEDLMKQSTQAIQNRLDVFHSEFMSRIFGQPEFNFPLRKWMDDGYMVLYDFNGMGEEEVAIIGGYLSYLYYRVADTRPDRSLFHSFIIDESQRVKASILPEIIAEMRSKGLGLGISTQTLDGLDSTLRNKLVNVAGSVFVCGQGPDGAKQSADVFKVAGPDGKDKAKYPESFFREMPTLRCAIRTEDKGKKVFAVVDVPPLDRYKPDGTIALFGDSEQANKETLESNNWTYAKAKELEQKNGGSIEEVDKAIQLYMSRGTKAPPIKPQKKIIEMDGPDNSKVVKTQSILDRAKGEEK